MEPDGIKQSVSRSGLSQFLSLPIETVRRRVNRLKKIGILSEIKGGLIVSQANSFRFGNNHKLQTTNVVLVKKLLRDLNRAGIRDPPIFRKFARPRVKGTPIPIRAPLPFATTDVAAMDWKNANPCRSYVGSRADCNRTIFQRLDYTEAVHDLFSASRGALWT